MLLILLLPWISISLDPDPILDPRFLLKIAQTLRIRIEIEIRSQDPGSTLENTSLVSCHVCSKRIDEQLQMKKHLLTHAQENGHPFEDCPSCQEEMDKRSTVHPDLLLLLNLSLTRETISSPFFVDYKPTS